MNKYSGVRIEFHILQSFPVTCLNRDDVGSPKDAIVGGVRRARISSQCWKRQVRLSLHEQGLKIAVRTKKISQLILKNIDNPSEDIIKAADVLSEMIAKDTLIFISENEASALYDYLTNNLSRFLAPKSESEKKALCRDIFNVWKQATPKSFACLDGIDIALFGRMLATAPDLNVQSACSFSHAITTHKVSSEVDYFTAVDDMAEEDNAGAGHVGANEFNSGTYYRYVSLDLGMLYESIGNEEDMGKAVDAFTKALYLAVPSARQNTLAGYCLWDYAHVFVRKGQNIQLSFDKPVIAGKDGYLEPSITCLEDNLAKYKSLMGSLFGEKGNYVFGKDANYSIENLCDDLKAAISSI